MDKLLTVSPSPHVHSKDSTQKIMYRVVLAMVPALAWSVFAFGIGSAARYRNCSCSLSGF